LFFLVSQTQLQSNVHENCVAAAATATEKMGVATATCSGCPAIRMLKINKICTPSAI